MDLFCSVEEIFRALLDRYPAKKENNFVGFIYANMAADTSNARAAYTLFLEKYPQHDLCSSVEWELKYLGKDINEIEELKNLGEGTAGPIHEK